MKKMSLVLAVVFVAMFFVTAGFADNHGVEISPRKALDIAAAHAGADRANLVDADVELESWHKKLVYDVEFEFGGFDHHYHLSAENGEILRYHKEPCD